MDARADLSTLAPAPHRARAIGLILCAMVAFSLQDLVVKLVAQDVSLWQMQAVRSIAVVAMLVVLMRARGRGVELIPTRLRWPLLRAVALSGAYFFFYASLPYLSLAEAGAGFFTAPIMITLLAAATMGERLGWQRLAAVGVGFLGVFFIIRPGTESFKPAMLLPLGAAFCYAVGIVLTRWRCSDQPSYSLTMVHNVFYALVGLLGVLAMPILPFGAEFRAEWPFLTQGWMHSGALPLAMVVVTAVTHMIGAQCSVQAYQISDAGRIAPFEYTYLALTPIWDILIWGQWPDLPTVAGMVLICAAGSVTAWHEGRTRHGAREVPGAREAQKAPGARGGRA